MPVKKTDKQEPEQGVLEYGTFDPAEVDPAPDLAREAEVAEDDKPPEFDERHKDPFSGLMYLGALTKKFEWLGHTFLIRTLKTDELLAIGTIVKDWDETIAAQRAYTTAVVALATISVDGELLPIPVEERPEYAGYAWARHRFDHVKARWFPYVIDYVYNEFLTLEKTAQDVIEAMGKASG